MKRALVGLALLLAPALAQAAAGQVLFALGRVEIQRDGQTLSARRGMAVEVGDTIDTGPQGIAQLRFSDGALLSLRAGSVMTVEDFRLPAPAAAAAAPVAAAPRLQPQAAAAPQGGRSLLRLVRGAFRTVTGLIGKGADDQYQVVTPAATIGIRGTDYSAAYCAGDCGATPEGLYVGVSNGEVFVNNDAGELVLADNQYGYVRDAGTPPSRELAPPKALEAPIDAPDEGEDAEDADDPAPPAGGDGTAPPAEPAAGDGSGTSYTANNTSSQPEGTYELRPGQSGSYGFALGPFQSAPAFAGAGNNGVYTDSSGALIGLFGADTQRVVLYSLGSASNVNQGGDGETGLRWGRWAGGSASVGGVALNLSNQSLHWIYAFAPSAPAMPITGSAGYTLVGHTNPTDNFGNVGFLGSATFSANFLDQTVSSTLDLGIADTVWQASGTGEIVAGGVFAGSYGVSVNDSSGAPLGTGSGSFAGFFTGDAAAAGLSYSLVEGGTTVSGVAAFQKAPLLLPPVLVDGSAQ